MYKLILNSDSILRISDGAIIPNDSLNSDYKQYADWVALGNSPLPADASANLELSCSPWQIRKALNQLGLREAVEGLIKTTMNQEVKDGWDFATVWKEHDPLVKQMGYLLRLSDTDIHNIFILAKDL